LTKKTLAAALVTDHFSGKKLSRARICRACRACGKICQELTADLAASALGSAEDFRDAGAARPDRRACAASFPLGAAGPTGVSRIAGGLCVRIRLWSRRRCTLRTPSPPDVVRRQISRCRCGAPGLRGLAPQLTPGTADPTGLTQVSWAVRSRPRSCRRCTLGIPSLPGGQTWMDAPSIHAPTCVVENNFSARSSSSEGGPGTRMVWARSGCGGRSRHLKLDTQTIARFCAH
jgi:hypothetical protein